MKAHELKILPQFYKDIFDGKKSFDLRKDDRDFQVGDYIIFCEYDGKRYTGMTMYCQIKYILRDVPEFGLMDGYCILGLE